MRDVETLKPFTRFLMTIGTLPSSYLISMTYEEQLLWFCNFLKNEVIPTVNNNAEAVIELQNYVSSYFENLDVQEEINNKLDEMAEAGTLEEIIAEYLNSTAVFGFDTVADMKSATNLINGSYAKTLGYHSINDGGAATYKIRTITNSDVVDGGSIIAMDDETLIAECIIIGDVNAKLFGATNNREVDSLNSLNNAINYCKNNNKTLLLDGYFYINDTLDTKGVKIKGLGKQLYVKPTFTSKTYGYLGYDYLNNVNDGALVDFDEYCDSVLTTGSGIISDIANPIIQCDYKDGRFELENMAIVGWLRNAYNQIGCESICTDDSITYFSGRHHFNNVTAVNCSGDGVKLISLEQTEINNCNFQQNFGHGLYIKGYETGSGLDAPFELVTFNKCFFDTNKLGGIMAEDCFRANVYFNNVDVGRSGLYQIMNISIPETISDVASGIKIKGWGGYTNPLQRTTNLNIEFNNVFGEEVANLISINAYEEGQTHLFNNMTVRNCTSNHNKSSDNNSLLYLDSSYFGSFSYYDNYFLSSTGNEIILSDNVATITPRIASKALYNVYQEVKTTQLTSSFTWTLLSYKKYGDIIMLSCTGSSTSETAAWSTILSGIVAPDENFNIIISDNTNHKPIKASVNTNRTIQTSEVIPANAQITIDLVYTVKPN